MCIKVFTTYYKVDVTNEAQLLSPGRPGLHGFVNLRFYKVVDSVRLMRLTTNLNLGRLYESTKSRYMVDWTNSA